MPTSGNPAELQREVDRAMNALALVTSAHAQTWHLDRASWSVDQSTGLVTFVSPKGIQATAPVQIIGTYDTQNGSWLWAWDNPSIAQALTKDARTVLEYGRTHGFHPLTTRKLQCTEQQCWEFTALAYSLCNANGAYRGPAGATMVFMIFGEITLTGNPAQPTQPVRSKERPAPQSNDSDSSPAAFDIRRLVEAFIHDFFQWNENSFAEKPGHDPAAAYEALVAKYCVPGVEPQPISYGSDSMHKPGLEKIESIQIHGDTAVVKTRHTEDEGSLAFTTDYEYQFERLGDRWLLRSLLYVNEEGKYECL